MIYHTQSAFAQGEITVGRDFIVGSRAAGMGGAFTSVADDFTALYWNPAGLSQIRQFEFYGGLSHEKLEAETRYFDDTDSTFASKTKPNSFGLVIPVPTYQGGLAFAFGINRVQSFDSRTLTKGFNNLSIADDPEFGLLYVNELTSESGGIYSWDFGAAVDIAPSVSLGAALGFLNGDYSYDLKLDADDTKQLDPDITGFSYKDTISSDYFGVQGKVGLLAKIAKPIRIGLTVDVPLDFSVEEYWTQDTYYIYDDDTDESEYDEGSFSYDISRPFRFNGGLSLLIPNAILAVDASYTGWTQTEYSDPPSEDISNEDFINDYRDTVRLSVGGEYSIPEAGVKIRAGYMYDPIPYTPSNIEIKTERQFITVGVGLVMDAIFSLDVAYMRGFWKESINNGDIEKNRSTNRILLSAGYRF